MFKPESKEIQNDKTSRGEYEMTAKEHQLMAMMFARQDMMLKILADIMGSHGMPIGDDFQAFGEFARLSESMSPDVILRTTKLYEEAAQKLGLAVRVKGYPE
jgi:hypothetical protein